jgi:hypothetical protein
VAARVRRRWGGRFENNLGKVLEHRGAYVLTRCACYARVIPLFPISSFWIAPGEPTRRIRLVGRSVAAVYIRWWGPVFALLAIGLAPGIVGLVVPVAVMAVWAVAWRWRWLASRDAVFADFDAVVLGSACPPRLLLPADRAAQRSDATGRWNDAHRKRPPEDIAREGTDDADEAVQAYACLRLASVDDAEAATLVRAMVEQRPASGAGAGPYRDAAGTRGHAVFHGHVAERVAALATVEAGHDSERRLATLAMVALAATAIVFGIVSRDTWTTPEVDLAAILAGRTGAVAMRCDRVRDVIRVGAARTEAVAACDEYGRIVFVLHDSDTPVTAVVHGVVVRRAPPWLEVATDALAADDQDRVVQNVALDATRDRPHLGFRSAAIAALLAAIGVWLGIVRRRR